MLFKKEPKDIVVSVGSAGFAGIVSSLGSIVQRKAALGSTRICCWRSNDWRWLSRIGWHPAAKLLPAPQPRVHCDKLRKAVRVVRQSAIAKHDVAGQFGGRVRNRRHWLGPLLVGLSALPIITATRLKCIALPFWLAGWALGKVYMNPNPVNICCRYAIGIEIRIVIELMTTRRRWSSG